MLDWLASRIMMPLSGLAIAIYVGWLLGRALVRDEIQLGGKVFYVWVNVLRYVVPVGIMMVFLHELGWVPWG